MNFKLKLVCLVLALAMILPFAFSCNDKGNNGDNGSGSQPPEENKEPIIDPNLLYFVLDGKTDYVIVRPAGLNEGHRIVQACNDFAAAVKERTGVEMPVITDAEPAGEKEIIVGETTRPESLELLREIKNNSYTIKAYDSKIVIFGYSDSITIGAFNYFADMTVNCVNNAEKIISIEKTLNISYNGGNERSDVRIMGTPISQFTVVYPQKYTGSDKRFASYLVEQIYNVSGAFVRMNTDSSDYENEILVGRTNRTVAEAPTGHVFNISAKGGKLQFQWGSMFAAIAAVDYVTGEFFSSKRPIVNINEHFDFSKDVSSSVAKSVDNISGEYRLMVQNIWGNTGDNHITRHTMTIDLALAYNVDVISLQEVDPRNRQGGDLALDKLLASYGYAEAVPPAEQLSGNNYTPVFYKTEKFDLIECAYFKYDVEYGTQFNDRGSKGYTWAVLKDKKTGDTFAVLSTHFWYRHEIQPDDNNARLRDADEVIKAKNNIIQKYGEIPIFVSGDLNCGYKSNPVSKIINSGAVWAPYASKNYDNIQSNHAYPTYSNDLGTYITPITPASGKVENSIDHILVFNSKNTSLNRYDVCTDLYSLLTSDHCALFLDFEIK